MRKTAGFLKGCCTFVLIILIVVAVVLVMSGATIAFAGSFSELAAKAGNAITITGKELTPAEMDAFKPIILAVLAIGLASVILAIIGTLKTRTALAECKEERPFSQKCVDSLKASARIEVISGLAAIACSVIMSFAVKGLTVGGVSVGSSSTTISLSFVIYAVMKYLLYHVANYGHSLERDPRRR